MANFGIPLYYGRVHGSYIKNLPVGQYARINLITLGDCSAPSGSTINVPGEASNNVHIRCDGPCMVQYSINGSNINDMVGGFIATNMARELKWPDTVIKSINLYCVETGASQFTNVAVEVQK